MTSNFIRRSASGLLLAFLLSCSSTSEKSSDEESIKLAEELESLSKNIQAINVGPTLKNGGPFIDKTNDYGLSGLYAVTFNAVDFNFDGHTDLVILPTYYSRPKFYVWNQNENKFLPWSHDPLPVDFKASYLLIYDMNKDRIPDLIAGVLNQRSEVSQIPLKIYYGQMWEGKLTFEVAPEAINLPI